MEKLKQDDIIELTIADQGMDGEGIGRYGEYTVFVPFALSGEKVKAKVSYVKKSLAFCSLMEVFERASERVEYPCNRFMRCGGCDLMHQSYKGQLALKQKKLQILLKKNARVDIPVNETVPCSTPYGYRNKIQLPIGMVNGRVAVGFYRENSHKIVSITKCFLHGNWVETLISVFLGYANENKVSVFDERTKKGILRHLVARYLDKEISVVVVTNNAKLPNEQKLINALNDAFPEGFSLYYSPKKAFNNVVLGETVVPIKERKQYVDILGIKAEINPYSFLQLNNEMRDKIYISVINKILADGEKPLVIDAYAGVGIIGAVLAKNNAMVYNIEIIKEATDDGNNLAELNKLSNRIININGDAAKELPNLIKRILSTQTDALSNLNIILDPPRRGCDQTVITALNEINVPHKLYYISCNPATLTRDLNLLTSYTVTEVTPYDMFPMTSHIETLVSLCRK